jgi:hypothetical protein
MEQKKESEAPVFFWSVALLLTASSSKYAFKYSATAACHVLLCYYWLVAAIIRDSPDSNNPAVTMVPAIGRAAVALVLLLLLLSFIPLCRFIISSVSDMELIHFIHYCKAKRC